MKRWSEIKPWAVPMLAIVAGVGVLSGIYWNVQQRTQALTNADALSVVNSSNPNGTSASGANKTVSNSTGSHSTSSHSAASTASNNPVDPGTSLDGRPAPNFNLVNQFGKPVSLNQFRGKVVVLAFVDSECTTICPLTTQSMMDALKLLGPTAASHVQLLGVNANPTAIAVSDVKNYSVTHDMLHSWDFVTGSLKQLKSVWANYYIESQIVNGQIDHTPALYIIDPQGKEQVLYLTPSQYSAVSAQADVLARDIAKYLPQQVRPTVPTIPYKAPAYTTTEIVPLQRLTTHGTQGTVTVGPGKGPQLISFFASWVPNLDADLKALNNYASQPGSPGVIGVDVGSTEPTPNALQPALKSLGSLNFPVGMDSTGDLADTYQVTDLMWLTLTDGQGHIIWSHDGWLPESTLKSDVQKALQKAHLKP
ncbi:SCO family protein [Alicyclobacillus tolerans]|uniref:SCO family protein n=1 Tax=Alicyclobacillus tolerans TaxID=90970 RepID=UPI001F34C186|nr:SCO family protein [Alicyclobacillus tolerans]MCF8564713.1 SCO family protein [Alicyclobacillus tolerans]